MTDNPQFDPALADEARVHRVHGDLWTLVILHAPDHPLVAWEFTCSGPFIPDVLDIVGPKLNREGFGYAGEQAWYHNGTAWSAPLSPARNPS